MTTPLRRQYLDIKRRYPQAILFFRLGDFYETFDQDTETIARELDIVLTSRQAAGTPGGAGCGRGSRLTPIDRYLDTAQ